MTRPATTPPDGAVWDRWVLALPWPSPPLVMNGSAGNHWGGKADKIKAVRSWTARAAQHAGVPPLPHCWSWLEWTVPDRRRRDAENPMPTAKAAWDGLTDAGVYPDDTPEHITKLMPVIRYVKGQQSLALIISATVPGG